MVVNSHAEAFALMEEHLSSVTIELFDAYGFEVARLGGKERIPEERGRCVCSIIGYAADAVRGALVLLATPPAVTAWRQSAGASTDGTSDLCDTIGEFSNMLLGRLKSRLLTEGLPILLATPTTAIGLNVELSPSAAISSWMVFGSASWEMVVRFHANFDQGFALQKRAGIEPPAEAGEMMLF
jgi:CheY-specific phosphatase CheX